MMRCTMMYMRSVWNWNDLLVYMDDFAVIKVHSLSAVDSELGIGWFSWVGLTQVFLCVVGLTQIGWVVWVVVMSSND